MNPSVPAISRRSSPSCMLQVFATRSNGFCGSRALRPWRAIAFRSRRGCGRSNENGCMRRNPSPPVAADIGLGFILELGRHGSGKRLIPAKVEYTRPYHGCGALEEHYGCPIDYRASRNAISFHTADIDLPFPAHSREFLEFITPGLESAFRVADAKSPVSEKIKAFLKRSFQSGRVEFSCVAREMAMSERTLQRRISAEVTTFRHLLAEARKELCMDLLASPANDVVDIVTLLGYQDVTSFYRAFKRWEGMSPGEWRHRFWEESR
ncbi:conserved hypothetical protein, partial [Ricinus communis]